MGLAGTTAIRRVSQAAGEDMFSRVLVGYDGSPGARRAVELGTDLARAAPDADLLVVAVEGHLPHYGATVGEFDEERELEERECRRWLEEATAYTQARGVAARAEVVSGHPAQQLLHAAHRAHADLVVLGHSGHSAVWGRFLGTTVEKVSRHATCSVLIAAPSAGRGAAGDDSWV